MSSRLHGFGVLECVSVCVFARANGCAGVPHVKRGRTAKRGIAHGRYDAVLLALPGRQLHFEPGRVLFLGPGRQLHFDPERKVTYRAGRLLFFWQASSYI